jgi:Uma2 family endonuclease
MTAVRQIKLISVNEYLAGEEDGEVRHEYLGGYVYAMAGARNVHNIIASAFQGALHSQLRGRPCISFNSDTKVRIQFTGHTRFYYPDGMVVCERNPLTDSFQDKPVVIAEVISEATRRTDEGEKRESYFTIPALMAYLIIESNSPQVVVHRRTSEGFVAEIHEGLDAEIKLESIGAVLQLSELYENVDFTSVQ